MTQKADIFYGRIALSSGIITHQQFDDCIRTVELCNYEKSIREILLEKKYITEKQAEVIDSLVKSATAMSEEETQITSRVQPSTESSETKNSGEKKVDVQKPISLIGQIIIKRGLASEQQIRECLRLQEEYELRGTSKQLGEILIEKKILTPEQLTDILREQNKIIYSCIVCGANYNIPANLIGKQLKCIRCGSELSPASKVVSTTVLTSFDKSGQVEDPLIGTLIGGCKVLRRVGIGGMATVYQARHLGMNKIVALKILPPTSAQNRDMIQRFVQEAQNAARLEHPNIVQIYNAGFDKGFNFIVMQYLKGKTLKDIVEERELLAREKALNYIRQVATGLSFAHVRGIIHKDVKPDNIIIVENDLVKIMDFGLAQDLNIKTKTTAVIAGTPHYMSPEQWLGKTLDGRTDIYSLGITFYYLLTGKHPFTENGTVKLMKCHLNSKPIPIESISNDVPKFYCAIIYKMMKKDREQRYRSCDELIKDIDRITQGLEPYALTSTQEMVECSFCGTLNPKSRRKCSICNEDLEKKDVDDLLSIAKFKCPNCKAINIKGKPNCHACNITFCSKCKVNIAARTGLCQRCMKVKRR